MIGLDVDYYTSAPGATYAGPGLQIAKANEFTVLNPMFADDTTQEDIRITADAIDTTILGYQRDQGTASLGQFTDAGARSLIKTTTAFQLPRITAGVSVTSAIAIVPIGATSNLVRITPNADTDTAILNVTNAANSVNWLAVNANGQVLLDGAGETVTGSLSADGALFVSGATTLDGSLSVVGATKLTPGAFAAGDLYLIVDASGNVHKSALGPAS